MSASIRTALSFAWRFAGLSAAAACVAILLTTPSEQFGAPEPVSVPTAVRQAAAPAIKLPAPRTVEYPAIAEHPLFYPTRRPWVPPPLPEQPPPVAAAPSPLTDYSLIGVVASDSMRTALVRARANKVLTLSEGQEIDGWTLKEITPERLYFTAGEATYEMISRKLSEIR